MKYIVDLEEYDLHIKVFTSKLSLVRYLNKMNYACSMEFDNTRGLALMYENKGVDLLLYLNEKHVDEDTLDHEVIHLTWYIDKVIGHPITFSTQEFQTYLFTHLKRKIKSKINGKQQNLFKK